jgi:nitrate reductase cytochrome c-type subunit
MRGLDDRRRALSPRPKIPADRRRTVGPRPKVTADRRRAVSPRPRVPADRRRAASPRPKVTASLPPTLAVPRSTVILALAALTLLGAAACADDRWDPVPGSEDAVKSSAEVRAGRRLFDGAPPTIPHDNFGVACGSCHDEDGLAVDGLGFAPASPHDGTSHAAATQRCRQCHVFVEADGVFAANTFQGLEQDMRSGGRLYPGAPPTIPHGVFLRENCLACHTGPGAREEIVTSHPDRARCRQCHVPVETRKEFQMPATGRTEPPSTDPGGTVEGDDGKLHPPMEGQ